MFSLILGGLLWAAQSILVVADWQQLDRNADGDTLSIDSGSIERNGVVVRFTEQIVFIKPQQTQLHGLLKSLRTRYAMNCKNQTNAPLALQAVTISNEVVGLSLDAAANPEFVPIAENPGAPDRTAFNYLCLSR